MFSKRGGFILERYINRENSSNRLKSWKLIPLAPFKQSTCFSLAYTAPLLEKERHRIPNTRVSDIKHPLELYGPSTRSRLPANDSPVDTVQVGIGNRTEQGFERNELYSSIARPERLRAISVSPLLYRYSHPHIRRPSYRPVELLKAMRSLRENLESVPAGLTHHLEEDKCLRTTGNEAWR